MKDEIRSREEEILRDGLHFLADREIQNQTIPTKLLVEQKEKTMKNASDQRQRRMISQNFKLVTLAVLVIASIVGLLFLPPGRAFASRVASFFNLQPNTRELPLAIQTSQVGPVISTPTQADENAEETLVPVELNSMPLSTSTVKPHQTFFLQVERPTEGNPGETAQALPLDQLKASAGFDVIAPPELPQGYSLQTAAYDKGSGNVVLTYTTNIEEKRHLFVVITEAQGLNTNDIGFQAQVDAVSFGSWTGELVQGGWMAADGQAFEAWDNDVPLVTLRWSDSGVTFTVQVTLLQEPTHSQVSSREEALSIAQSLMEMQTPSSEAQTSPGSKACLSIAEAEERAGFLAVQPTVLPEGVAFTCAEFQQMLRPTIILRYHQTEGEGRLSLIIFETPKALIPGGEITVSAPDDQIEKVTISGQPGFFVTGTYVSPPLPDTWLPGTPAPTPVWDSSSAGRVLSWDNGDLWVEMNSLTGLTKEAMIQIAESLQ
jgi:hypothetical protein